MEAAKAEWIREKCLLQPDCIVFIRAIINLCIRIEQLL